MLIRVLLIVLATTGAAFSQGYGNWSIGSERDKFTDNLDIYLTTQSKEKISCGRSSSRASIVDLDLVCTDNKTLVAVTAQHCGFFVSRNSDDYVNMKYRVDKLPAKTKRLYGIGEALAFFPGGQSISFIKDLIGHDEVIMQLIADDKSSEIATFSLNGLEAKVAKLRKACNW